MKTRSFAWLEPSPKSDKTQERKTTIKNGKAAAAEARGATPQYKKLPTTRIQNILIAPSRPGAVTNHPTTTIDSFGTPQQHHQQEEHPTATCTKKKMFKRSLLRNSGSTIAPVQKSLSVAAQTRSRIAAAAASSNNDPGTVQPVAAIPQPTPTLGPKDGSMLRAIEEVHQEKILAGIGVGLEKRAKTLATIHEDCFQSQSIESTLLIAISKKADKTPTEPIVHPTTILAPTTAPTTSLTMLKPSDCYNLPVVDGVSTSTTTTTSFMTEQKSTEHANGENNKRKTTADAKHAGGQRDKDGRSSETVTLLNADGHPVASSPAKQSIAIPSRPDTVAKTCELQVAPIEASVNTGMGPSNGDGVNLTVPMATAVASLSGTATAASTVVNPAQSAAAAPISLYEESLELWTNYLLETYSQIDAETDFEPFPFNKLVGGAVVDADGDYCEVIESPLVVTAAQARNDNGCQDGKAPALHGKGNVPTQKATSLKGKGNVPTQKATSLKGKGNVPTQKAPALKGKSNVPTQNKYKRDSDSSLDEEPLAKVSKSEVVGPNTWQMKVVHRMVIYLEESKDCAYAHLIGDFQSVIAKCTDLHLRGSHKHHHLPGVIFDELVDVVGGEAFLAVYQAAKTFDHPRVELLDFSKTKSPIPPTVPEINQNDMDLMKVAIGYGFIMARAARESAHLVGDTTIQAMVEEGAQLVFDMTKAERLDFYTEHIEQA
jgi:hypothetical protein